MKHRAILKHKSRIVIKTGTRLLTHENGKLNLLRMEKLVRMLAELQNRGKEVLLVSSGAVGAGMGKLTGAARPGSVVEKQALAAIGQAELVRMYQKFFDEYNKTAAQVLLTRDGIENALRRNNARNTLHTLLEMGVIPIINENDTVSTAEIEFGDNDILSACVANLVQADLLMILTNTNGVYTSDPFLDTGARQVPKVLQPDEDLKDVICSGKTHLGSGGMESKIAAAELCRENNVDVVIADGNEPEQVFSILEGELYGTMFVSQASQIQTNL